ncbi:MAG: hypothetical protein HFG22_18135 [Lachnospiraceae bacterium]|nr:hypothetical protein [Lachnospiraceae bacterium]
MSKEQQTPWTKEIYTWVASMKCARVGKNPDHIYFCCKGRKGTISFYEGTIIELVVEDKATGETPFYIHFAIQDIQETKENVEIFFRFLEGKEEGKAQLDVSAIRQTKPLKLLVSCSCGITSSYFALLMQQALDGAGSQIQVAAVSYTEVEKVQEAYDHILLAPQIGYMLPKFQQKYGDKVLAIDMVDFASRNVEHVINVVAQEAHAAA